MTSRRKAKRQYIEDCDWCRAYQRGHYVRNWSDERMNRKISRAPKIRDEVIGLVDIWYPVGKYDVLRRSIPNVFKSKASAGRKRQSHINRKNYFV